jgi:putative ABC transport system permease protein
MRDRWRTVLLPRLGHSAASEMDDEIAAHQQLHADDLIRSGFPPTEATRQAAERVGRLYAARDELHHAARRREAQLRHRDWWGGVAGDLKFALRQIRRNAGYFALAVLTLALGIGMTTAIFTLVERVVLQPLPLRDPGALVTIRGLDSLKEQVWTVSNDDWLDWKAGSHSFSAMALQSDPYRVTVRTGDSATRVTETPVSSDFFQTIGARFVAGRPFTAAEADAGDVMVITERLWRAYLRADPSLSRPLSPGGTRVVGVVADGAEFPADVQIWLPMKVVSYGGGGTRNNINSVAVARLNPGVTADQAAADLSRVSRGIRARDPAGIYDFGAAVIPLQTAIVGGTATSLRLLGVGVALVMLIVCANLAIATLGRGSGRRDEMAIRTALGASQSRLVAQLVVEQLLLAGVGCLGGLVLAWGLVHAIVTRWGTQIPRAGEIHLDVGVLAFAIVVALLVGLVSGVVPAIRSSRVSLQHAMKEGGRQTTGGKQPGAIALVMFEFALAVALVSGAGLLLRSFGQLVGRDLGFSRNLATAEITMLGGPYRDSTFRLATWDRLAAAYSAIPGVQRVGIANQTPLGEGFSGFIAIDGSPNTVGGAGYRTINEGYLGALGLHLLRGRNFGPEDAPGAARGVIINQAMARKYWPGQDPLGHRVQASSMEAGNGVHAEAPAWLTVVGVVSDVRQRGFAVEPAPEMYVSFRQAPQWRTVSMTLVVGAARPAAQLLAALRAKTREVDPRLGVDLDTMARRLDESLASRTLTMSLLSAFALLALLLAALGVYAVLSYLVTRRSREIALRAALGAQRSRILSLIVGQGMRIAGLGILAGIVAAAVLSRVLTALLVDVSAVDPIAFVGAVVILAMIAFLAALIPALRAMRLDPMAVLKQS